MYIFHHSYTCEKINAKAFHFIKTVNGMSHSYKTANIIMDVGLLLLYVSPMYSLLAFAYRLLMVLTPPLIMHAHLVQCIKERVGVQMQNV
jgi:hypothetical protein